MSKVWYGNLSNRLEEGRNFTGREIKVGDDGTMYMYSDRHPFYVVGVENQKRIKVREYYHCADHDKDGGMGHQDWMLFKTWDEWNDYLSRFFPEHHKSGDHRDEPEPQTWVFRYGKWMREVICTKPKEFDPESGLFSYMTERDKASVAKNGYYKRYYPLSGGVSFGKADYYYDWEF